MQAAGVQSVVSMLSPSELETYAEPLPAAMEAAFGPSNYINIDAKAPGEHAEQDSLNTRFSLSAMLQQAYTSLRNWFLRPQAASAPWIAVWANLTPHAPVTQSRQAVVGQQLVN
jgi:hypothetical protein